MGGFFLQIAKESVQLRELCIIDADGTMLESFCLFHAVHV